MVTVFCDRRRRSRLAENIDSTYLTKRSPITTWQAEIDQARAQQVELAVASLQRWVSQPCTSGVYRPRRSRRLQPAVMGTILVLLPLLNVSAAAGLLGLALVRQLEPSERQPYRTTGLVPLPLASGSDVVPLTQPSSSCDGQALPSASTERPGCSPNPLTASVEPAVAQPQQSNLAAPSSHPSLESALEAKPADLVIETKAIETKAADTKDNLDIAVGPSGTAPALTQNGVAHILATPFWVGALISKTSAPVSAPGPDAKAISPEPWMHPVANAPLTSGFGERSHPISKVLRFHYGIDFGTPIGTPIRAARSGRVIFAGRHGGYGKFIAIEHANGYRTNYAHLQDINIAVGDQVSVADIIGLSGNTGYTTGPHLHFELLLNGQAIDPLPYLFPPNVTEQ